VCCSACCTVLHCVALCCTVLHRVVVSYSMLQCVAVCCSMLQCVAVCCSALHCAVALCYTVLHVIVCHSTLQHIVVCCSVLQCCTWRRNLPRMRALCASFSTPIVYHKFCVYESSSSLLLSNCHKHYRPSVTNCIVSICVCVCVCIFFHTYRMSHILVVRVMRHTIISPSISLSRTLSSKCHEPYRLKLCLSWDTSSSVLLSHCHEHYHPSVTNCIV